MTPTALSERLLIYDFMVQMGPVVIPGRSLVARENGRVIIFSPGPFGEEDFRKIQDFGEVVAIIAPNLLHHKWVQAALEKFPDARFFRAQDLGKKVPALEDRGEPFSKIGFANFKEMEFLELSGIPSLNECVFYFPKDRVLYVNDLVFHILKPASFLSNVLLMIMGTKGRLIPSKSLKFLVKDRKAFRRDLEKMFDWNFDRVVMAHGEPLLQDGKFRLQKALGKYLS